MSCIDDTTLDDFWTLRPVLLWGKGGEVQKASDMKTKQIYLFFKDIVLLMHKNRD